MKHTSFGNVMAYPGESLWEAMVRDGFCHHVQVSLPHEAVNWANGEYGEAIVWCENNLCDEYSFDVNGWEDGGRGRIVRYHFMFRDENDAIHFKLRWT